MTGQLGGTAALARLQLPRPTARLRLTLLYGCIFTLAGAGLLGFTIWLFTRATAGIDPTAIVVKVRPARHKTSLSMQFPGQRHLVAAGGRGADLHALNVHALLVQSGIALAVMAGLAFALGWLVAGRVLRPVRLITATARRISATSLHERLALAGPDDEFKELADTLDGLLSRLEASFTAQRHFVANASHELRTPLTLDKTLLQVRLRNPRATAEQWRVTGQELLESGQQQERLLEALLSLATSEAGLSRREPADLAEVTAARLPAARSAARRRGLRIETSLRSAPLLGDPDLVDRLVANLLDNAVGHNVSGGTVEVTTATREGGAVVSVANTGHAIPPAEIDRLFQPFQRLTCGRTGDSDGFGLGLSIVRAIAAAHDAIIHTHARPNGGLHIEVSFPAAHPVMPCQQAASPRPALERPTPADAEAADREIAGQEVSAYEAAGGEGADHDGDASPAHAAGDAQAPAGDQSPSGSATAAADERRARGSVWSRRRGHPQPQVTTTRSS